MTGSDTSFNSQDVLVVPVQDNDPSDKSILNTPITSLMKLLIPLKIYQ